MAYVAVAVSMICCVKHVKLAFVPGKEAGRVFKIAQGERPIPRMTSNDTECKDAVHTLSNTILMYPKTMSSVTDGDCLEWCLRRLTCTVALAMRGQCRYSVRKDLR